MDWGHWAIGVSINQSSLFKAIALYFYLYVPACSNEKTRTSAIPNKYNVKLLDSPAQGA